MLCRLIYDVVLMPSSSQYVMAMMVEKMTLWLFSVVTGLRLLAQC